jgi:phenylalanyl-tRNA synthetase alpha chain
VQVDELERRFEALLGEYHQKLKQAAGEPEVRKAHADYGGSAGAIRRLQKEALASAPNSDKKAIGQLSNRFVAAAEEAFATALARLAEEARARDLQRSVDVTLPGRRPRVGHLSPITLVRREIEQIFAQLGFVVAEGPQIETDFHNFEALAMPADHPARDMQDTFYLEGAPELVLRTHTSPVQIRTMLARTPPVRIIAPGPVYRKDDDPTHSPMFYQIEGLCVDEGVRFSDLKGVLLHFVHRFFGDKHKIRLRPSFFPFTEPSAEVDVSWARGSGWLEIGGCGMVDPEVFRHVGYDSERYTGFAFGLGIDRMAMLRYSINDIKLLFDGDARFARMFR